MFINNDDLLNHNAFSMYNQRSPTMVLNPRVMNFTFIVAGSMPIIIMQTFLFLDVRSKEDFVRYNACIFNMNVLPNYLRLWA